MIVQFWKRDAFGVAIKRCRDKIARPVARQSRTHSTRASGQSKSESCLMAVT